MSINSIFGTTTQFLWVAILAAWILQRRQRQKHHLTHEEVLLEWAYAEVKSPRWRERFIKDMGGEEHFARITAAGQAEALEPEDKALLVKAFRARRGWMLDCYFLPTTRFEEMKLSMEELANLQLIPEMLPEVQTLREYARSTPKKPDDPIDPRNAAAKYLASHPSLEIPRPPIIVQGSAYAAPMLLEGYTRTVGFLLMLDREKKPYKKRIPCIVAINEKLAVP